MDLERFLEELSSSDGPISSAKLVHLSDLGPEEMQAFLKRWGSVPPARRRKLVGRPDSGGSLGLEPRGRGSHSR